MLRCLLVAVALAAGSVPAAAQPERLRADAARLSADELAQLDVLLDHACRTAQQPGTVCSRAAIALLDKIGRLNAGVPTPKESPAP